MKKIFRLLCILIALCFLTITCGCKNTKQLHERLIIQGVCVDKTDDEYVLTLSTFDAEESDKNSESQKSEGGNSNFIVCKGKSIMDAFTSVANSSGKDPMYSQNLILVIGNDTAKEGVSSLIDFFIRHYDARPSIEIFVSSGPAANVMKCKLNEKPISPKVIEGFAKSYHLNTNAMSSNLVEFVTDLQSKISNPHATFLNIDEDKLTAQGTAIFHDDKMIDILDTEKTKGALLIKGKGQGNTEVIDIENIGRISYTIMSSKSKVSISIIDDLPNFNIDIKVNANIYEIERSRDQNKNSLTDLESSLNEYIKKQVTETIDTCIKKDHCDILNFGRHLMKHDPTYFKKIEDKWNNLMSNATYNISVITKLNKTGQEINST